MINLWNGIKKFEARTFATLVDYIAPEAGAILLPGYNCSCLKILLENPIFDKKFLYLIERDKDVMSKINQFKIDNPCTYHLGELHDLEIKHPINYAFIDTWGSLDEKLFNWLKNTLVPKLISPYKIVFCFNYAWRKENFLKQQKERLKQNDVLYNTSYYYRTEDYHMCTYLALFKEIFNGFYFEKHERKPYYLYNDNVNPMVVFSLVSETVSATKEIVEEKEMSPEVNRLVSKFLAAYGNYDKMRGFKRSLTLYCRKKEKETGTPAVRFKAAIKMRIKKNGGNPVSI